MEGEGEAEAKKGRPGGSQAVAKAKAKSEKDDKKGESGLRQLMILVGKLSLTLEREVAMIRSIVVQIVMVQKSKDHTVELAEAVKSAMQGYNARSKELKTPVERSAQGSPHLLVWLVMMMQIKKDAELVSPELVTALTRYFNWLEKEAKDLIAAGSLDVAMAAKSSAAATASDTQEEDLVSTRKMVIEKDVKVCKFKRCWNPAEMRIEVNVKALSEAERAWEAAKMFIVKHCGGQIKHGQAPRGDLARKIAAKLEKMGAYRSDDGQED